MVSHSIFDTEVKKVDVFSVNLDVLYHGSWFAFALFWWYMTWKEVRLKFDKSMLIIILMYLSVRFILNLLSINEDYEVYSNLVSNEYIDKFTWILIAILILIKLWEKFIVSRQ